MPLNCNRQPPPLPERPTHPTPLGYVLALGDQIQVEVILHTLQAEASDPMKRLLILGVMVLAPNAADAKPPAFQCPGENTVQMRYCAEKSWNSPMPSCARR